MTNYNVTLTFVYKISFGVAYGMWAMSVLSNYIYILGGDNREATEMVGYAEALEGTMIAAAALPVGWLGSNMRRDTILKFSGVAALAAIAMTVAAVRSVTHKYALLCAALALWGINEASSPILDSLFADSVPTGQRTGLYTTMFVCQVLTLGLGPLLASAYFYFQGDQWTLASLENVMLVGMVFSLVPAIVSFMFDDDKSLGGESEGILNYQPPDPSVQSLSTPGGADGQEGQWDNSDRSPASSSAALDQLLQHSQRLNGDMASPSASPTAANGAHYVPPVEAQDLSFPHSPVNAINTTGIPTDTCDAPPSSPPPVLMPQPLTAVKFGCLTLQSIPLVLALSDCIGGLASGMTVKFFPVFFKTEVSLSPTSTNLLFASTPVVLSLFSLASKQSASSLGRVPTLLLFKGLGICLLYIMAVFNETWQIPHVIIPLFLARTASMNCCYPIQKSILMDLVPKEARTKWNSLEALTGFGWSGSAAFGGVLLTKCGYATTFTITATMQLLAWLISMLLLPLVPRDEASFARLASARESADKEYIHRVSFESLLQQQQGEQYEGRDELRKPLLDAGQEDVGDAAAGRAITPSAGAVVGHQSRHAGQDLV